MGQHRSRMLTVQQFRSLYGEEEQCWAQLSRQRWPEGFRCPRCSGPSRGYMVARRVHECMVCGYQSSVTAGTIYLGQYGSFAQTRSDVDQQNAIPIPFPTQSIT